MTFGRFVCRCSVLGDFLKSASLQGVIQSHVAEVSGVSRTLLSSLKVLPAKVKDMECNELAIMGQKGCKLTNIVAGKYPLLS